MVRGEADHLRKRIEFTPSMTMPAAVLRDPHNRHEAADRRETA
jgi:hypothetical protein